MANRASVRTPQVIRFVQDTDSTSAITYTALQDLEVIDVSVLTTAAAAFQVVVARSGSEICTVTSAGALGDIDVWTAVTTDAGRVYVAAGQTLTATSNAAAGRFEVWVTVLPGLTASL